MVRWGRNCCCWVAKPFNSLRPHKLQHTGFPWASSGSWWWTWRPGVLQSMGSQRVRHNWGTELSLSSTISRSLLKLTSVESVTPSNHLILCHSLLLLPSIFPTIGVFSSELALHIRWPKYWSFSFSISPSNEYSGLISFRIDWFDLLALQGTLKSLLQHHNLKASILQCLAFFMVQLSHLYMTTGKTIALSIWNFVGKVTSLLFNMLSRIAQLAKNPPATQKTPVQFLGQEDLLVKG